MKRLPLCLMAVALILISIVGCQSNQEPLSGEAAAVLPETSQPQTLNVVCTIFPQYDWVRQIAGDAVDVTLLLDGGTDLHSYQATADDISIISSCDVLIYVGGDSDSWVEDALKNAVNPDMKVIKLMDILGDTIKAEEIVEGMEHEHTDEEAPQDWDEHIWLSLKNTRTCIASIAEVLSDLDSTNAADFLANATAYEAELDTLDLEYADTVSTATANTLVFGDRFPFRYLVDDYNLNYYAAFAGCSAETEASFETIIFLADKMNELNAKNIFIIDNSDGAIAKTIIQNTQNKDQEILTLNAMQSVTASDITDGATYLSIMQQNLDVLKTALSN